MVMRKQRKALTNLSHSSQLDQGGLNLPTRDNYLNKTAHKKVLDAYLDYMTRICVLLGANKQEARIQMNKVIQFETDLANITTPSEDRRDEEGLYNPFTIKEWQTIAPFLNWTQFFNDAFKLVNRTVSNFFTIKQSLSKVMQSEEKPSNNMRR